MSFTSLKRRVDALERPMCIKKPPEEAALEILTDNEMGLVAEFVALIKSGYGLDQIRQMMEEDSYQVAVEAIEKADAEYWRLMRPRPRHFISDIAPETKKGAHDENGC